MALSSRRRRRRRRSRRSQRRRPASRNSSFLTLCPPSSFVSQPVADTLEAWSFQMHAFRAVAAAAGPAGRASALGSLTEPAGKNVADEKGRRRRRRRRNKKKKTKKHSHTGETEGNSLYRESGPFLRSLSRIVGGSGTPGRDD